MPPLVQVMALRRIGGDMENDTKMLNHAIDPCEEKLSVTGVFPSPKASYVQFWRF